MAHYKVNPSVFGMSNLAGKGLAIRQKVRERIANQQRTAADYRTVNEEKTITDDVCLNIPLLIRLFEYCKEEAKDDVTLHSMAERMILLSKKGSLNMSHYDSIVSGTSEEEKRLGKTDTGEPGETIDTEPKKKELTGQLN